MTQPLHDWILSDQITGLGVEGTADSFCQRLRAEGVPVERAHCLALVRHPLFHGRSYHWDIGLGTRVENHCHGLQAHEGWQGSLFRRMIDGEEPDLYVADLRAAENLPAPLPELSRDGFTGYLAIVFVDSEGRRHVMSFGTRAAGGFAPEAVQLVSSLVPAMSYRIEIALARDFREEVLSTYVGRDPARRVLSGSIRRGDIEEIDAVIWFSDLRGFTSLSGTLPSADLASLLDDYFQAVVDATRAQGGEVLKFIGDGVLAVFRTSERGGEEACLAAGRAAEDLLKRLDSLDAHWQTRGGHCRAGVALHVGTVLYGNVGAADRLDFTVIGPAVNLASRIEGCGREHGAQVVVTEVFADQTTAETRLLGEFSLKGVPGVQRVFALEATES